MGALALILLLHHIEGVCKPRSLAGRVLDSFVASVGQRDRQAAVERAYELRAARVAHSQRRQVRRSGRPSVASERVPMAIEILPPASEVIETKDEGVTEWLTR